MDDYEMEESNSSQVVDGEFISDDLVDRLSELPLALIHDILSFLPMTDVVITTYLSKRWRNLWTTVPCLNFHECMMYGGEEDFVNRVLMLWKGTKVQKFSIRIEPHFYMSLAGDMDLWVKFAVENKVEELNIDLSYDIQEMYYIERELVPMNVYSAPDCLYSCSSMRKLRLVGCNLGTNGSVSWNHLKSLIIDGYFFTESTISWILSGSPRLEIFEFRFFESNEDLNILSTSLKKLKIKKVLYTNEDLPVANTVLRICCPNLDTLEISGVLYSKCLFTNVSSLTDATIGFNEGKLLEEMLRQILLTIQHVEKVTLSSLCVKVFGTSKKKHFLSPLQNCKFLKLDACSIELSDMMVLLGIFPNVKMLVIGYLDIPNPPKNYMEFEANLPKSFLLQLKTLEITASFNDSSKLWFFEFLLKWASMLEKLVIRVKIIESDDYEHLYNSDQYDHFCEVAHEHLCEVAEKLLSMPRSSPTAKVIIPEFSPRKRCLTDEME